MDVAAIIFFVLFPPMILVAYFALTALDFGKIMRKNQYFLFQLLLILVSIALAYLVTSAVRDIITHIMSFFSK